MANVRLTPQELNAGGVAPTYNTSLSTSDTYLVANDGKIILHFKKTGAGACVVTVTTPGSFRGKAIPDETITVPASTGDRMVALVDRELYIDASGDSAFTVSEVTGLSVAVLRMP